MGTGRGTWISLSLSHSASNQDPVVFGLHTLYITIYMCVCVFVIRRAFCPGHEKCQSLIYSGCRIWSHRWAKCNQLMLCNFDLQFTACIFTLPIPSFSFQWQFRNGPFSRWYWPIRCTLARLAQEPITCGLATPRLKFIEQKHFIVSFWVLNLLFSAMASFFGAGTDAGASAWPIAPPGALPSQIFASRLQMMRGHTTTPLLR